MGIVIGAPWHSGYTRTGSPPLTRDVTTDVCVVGAGIAGLSIGLEAARAGLKVVVLDAGEAGGGETGSTTAHLTNIFDVGLAAVEHHAGTDGARLAANGHMAAIGRIEELSQLEAIACQFTRVNGYLFAHNAEADATIDDQQAAAERCNEPLWKPTRLAEAPIGPQARAALEFPNQGCFILSPTYMA